jgi:hypothetical protein
MAASQDVSSRPGPTKVNHFVFWDPCIGLGPIVVEEARTFLMGQAIIVAILLGLLGLLVIWLPPN